MFRRTHGPPLSAGLRRIDGPRRPCEAGPPTAAPEGRTTVLRTDEAGSLRAGDAGRTVTLAGWVARRRDHGGVAFLDLRDASGVVQVVVRDEAVAHGLRNEFVLRVTGEVRHRPEGNENPDPAHGRRRGRRRAGRGAQRGRAPAVPDRRARRGRRGGAAALPLPGPAPAGPGAAIRLRSEVNRAAREVLHEPRLRRDRDPDADPLHARGRARLPRAGPAPARLLVRAAAEPAAVQAAAHGRRHGALLPDRPLLPRRGLPGRPAAGVHPARHRDELRRPGRRHRARRGRARRAVAADRPRDHRPRSRG